MADGDKVDIFPRWYRINEFIERFHIIVIKWDGEDPETTIEATDFLRQHKDRFHVIEAPEGIDGISSSVVRDKLRDGDLSAEALCHPKVWKMIQKNGGIGTIPCFRNEYRFLSNFWNVPVTYDGLTYQNAEAAFQAQKCINEADKVPFTSLCANDAKRLGRNVQLRYDWDLVKLPIMKEIVRAKFTQNDDLKQQLLSTGNLVLEEGNNWRDRFWGINLKTGEGENHLGRILMQVRTELQI